MQTNKKDHTIPKPKKLVGIGWSAFLVGQTCSTLCSSASENLTAVLCSHSLSEAVLLLSLKLLWLVCLLHKSISSLHVGVCYSYIKTLILPLLSSSLISRPLQEYIIPYFNTFCQAVLRNFFKVKMHSFFITFTPSFCSQICFVSP